MSASELDPTAVEGALCHLENVLSARTFTRAYVTCFNLAWVPILIADILDMTLVRYVCFTVHRLRGSYGRFQ